MASNIHAGLMNRGLCWSADTGVPMCSSSLDNLIYEFITASSAVPSKSFPLTWWFVRWEASGRTTAVLWGVVSWICSKQHTAALCSFQLAFPPSTLSPDGAAMY